MKKKNFSLYIEADMLGSIRIENKEDMITIYERVGLEGNEVELIQIYDAFMYKIMDILVNVEHFNDDIRYSFGRIILTVHPPNFHIFKSY